MSVLQDVRFAVRLLVKDRWFTAAAAVALALGIGVNNTVFTLMNAVLLRGLPFDDPDRVISIRVADARDRWLGASQPDFLDWRDGLRSFSALTLVRTATVNVSDETLAPEPVDASYNSANLFHVIGQHPIVGRDFSPRDDQPGADPVVILGGDLWKHRYRSDPGAIGRRIKVDGVFATVIGVMAPEMRFPYNNDFWMPLSMLPPELAHSPRGVRGFEVLGRLAQGVTLPQARAELQTIAARLAHDYPDTNKEARPTLMTFSDRAAGTMAPVVFLALMGAVGFVLLIACANVANLLLARSAQRTREIGVRMSLGASRWRIIRQLLVESLMLAVLSGALGLGLSLAGVRLLDAVLAGGMPYWMAFTMDRTVFAFLAAICLGTAVAFGLAPALHVSRTDFNEVLKDGGRSSTSGVRARRWTGALIVAEMALTLMLLAGGGLMMRSVVALYRMAPGVDTSRLLTMRLNLASTKYSERGARTALFQQLEERLHGVSTIHASALTTHPPMAGGLERELLIEGRPAPSGTALPTVTVLGVSTGYFDTLGLPIVRGRAFTALDGTPGHEAAIVNQRFVAMHFPGEEPLGRHVRLIDGLSRSVDRSIPISPAVIVGVVPTMRQRNVREADPDPVIYVPYRVDPQRSAVLLVRGSGDPAALTSVVREQMRALEPDLPLYSIQTLDQLLALEQRAQRVVSAMFAVFAAIALVLSSLGLFAITAYAVTQRTSEIGVRIALGARPADVLWLLLRQGLWQLAIGLAVGMAGALAVGRLLRSLLAQTSSSDPTTLVSTAAIMVLVSLAACFLPARRATKLDPVSALRHE
jgi:putative ABC transport system permease protein